jgi:hypothetical protein
MKQNYGYNFFLHFLVGGAITYPLAVSFGRWSMKYTGGVPVVPH